MMIEEKHIWLGIGFMFGVLVGMMIIYKIELNTINQALDSLRYCYETYAITP